MRETLYFTVNWNSFSIWLNFHAHPNTLKGVKCFPDFIYHRNKCSLSNWVFRKIKNKIKKSCKVKYEFPKTSCKPSIMTKGLRSTMQKLASLIADLGWEFHSRGCRLGVADWARRLRLPLAVGVSWLWNKVRFHPKWGVIS